MVGFGRPDMEVRDMPWFDNQSVGNLIFMLYTEDYNDHGY